MSDIATLLKKRAAREVETRVNAHLPAGMQIQLNPSEDEEYEDDEDDEDGDDEDGDDEGLEDEEYEADETLLPSMAFEDNDKEDNLAAAAAAYRICGSADAVVASHSTGPAYYGTPEGLQEYSQSKDLQPDGWEVYQDSSDILDLEFDHDTLKKVIKLVEEREGTYNDAEDFYRKFHWGDNPNVAVVKNIPGVSGTLVHLGVGRRIDYGSKKNGEWAEYFHEFGENSDVYPSVYALMNEGETKPTCLIVHGGEMRVEGRGIVE
jgi:hypothetical protein